MTEMSRIYNDGSADRHTPFEMQKIKVLSDFELKVLNEYVNGASYVEIANKLDSHVKAVDNAVQRIKKKVDKHIEIDEI